MERKHSFSLLSIIRKNRVNTKDEYPIYLRITLEGKRAELATKICVSGEKWNAIKGRLKGTTHDIKSINQTLDNFEHRARDIYNNLLLSGKIFDAESIKNEITGIEHKQRMLTVTFDEFVQDIEMRIGHGYSAGTVKNWKVTQGHLKEFLKMHLHVSEITFKQLEYKFIMDFEWYARTKWKCGVNTALKHIERIRKVVHIAIHREWLDKDPFLNFKRSKDQTHRTFLSKHELQLLEKKNMPLERLEKVKDIFIFSCYSGLSYVDIEKLNQDNLVIGIDGKKWIHTFREKTHNKSNIPLLPQALRIIEKYQNEEESPKLLPVISNIKTNAYLKEIADICGIKKNLTFHMARHTFATTVTLSNGVPIETVSSMLGHNKISTTQIYAKVLENKVSDDMNKLELTLNNQSK